MSIIKKITNYLHLHKNIEDVVKFYVENSREKLQTQIAEMNLALRSAELKHLALSSTESGITNDALCAHEVVVSLTTYSKRIHEVYLTIESIMQGTVKPNRIILWLAEDEFTDKTLPIVLQNQIKRGLEVRYCKDIRSYKKIIPTLQLCPEACIITIDDDTIFEPDVIEHLITSYKVFPNCVSACRLRKIKTDKNGMPTKYNNWLLGEYDDFPSNYNFLTSGGGTLFPPHLLHSQVGNEELFMKLCPTADDLWLNAMLIINGTKVVKAFTHNPIGNDFLSNESLQVNSLWSHNKEDLGNDIQIKAIWNYFKLADLFKNI
ncbi:MAG: hypothetical protein K6A78_09820 [Prevotella sp.]|nr:hypothetical protein [Prevotella sp.]